MFEETSQHKMIGETAKKFVQTEINPHVEEWEKEGIYPAHDIFKKLGDLDLLGIHKPESVGGLGATFSYHAAFLRSLGYCDCSAFRCQSRFRPTWRLRPSPSMARTS